MERAKRDGGELGVTEEEVMPKEIFKDVVIGWVVLRCKAATGKNFIETVPLVVDWEGLLDEDGIHIEDEDEVITVIPALPGTYKVFEVLPDGTCKTLGFEFPGANCPNWQEV